MPVWALGFLRHGAKVPGNLVAMFLFIAYPVGNNVQRYREGGQGPREGSCPK